MNYSVLSRFQWIRLDANILETTPAKKKDRFSMCGQGLTLSKVSNKLFFVVVCCFLVCLFFLLLVFIRYLFCHL